MAAGRTALAFILLLFLPSFSMAVKPEDFKTCSQSGFCRRGRALSSRAETAGSSWKSPYSIDPTSVKVSAVEASLSARVRSSLYPDIHFQLDVQVHDDGVARVRMDEIGGLHKRYDQAASWALAAPPQVNDAAHWTVTERDARVAYGTGDKAVELVVTFSPLRVKLLQRGKEQIVLNGRGLLHMEHFRVKESPLPDEQQQVVLEQSHHARAWFEGDTKDGWWEETWRSWTDSKPKGPESLSLDIDFPNHFHVYGIPQHATSLSLPATTGKGAHYTDPYRLYNLDVFQYIPDSPMALYGSIPLMHAHSSKSTVAVFNAIASETWIDVAHPSNKATNTHWISESGILDLFLIPGPTPVDIFEQYAKLTGTPVLPAHWALGYHQCRWNYQNSEDVRSVQRALDQDNMPVDTFWLDIEYSEDHKYFIWNKQFFPDPVQMMLDVEAYERKMVVIIDPHLKRASDYPVYQEASDLQLLVKPKNDQGEFEGWCWPGSSSWVDFFNPKSRAWYAKLFKTKEVSDGFSWLESTENVHIWNDMNEPSVFSGPEITMPKDNIHYGNWEHRDVHNVNGMLFHDSTYNALLQRSDPPKRPFVLTRAFYAGSQRSSAMWTGDNEASWEHMAISIKMVLANGIAGLSFAGADVGGFFGDPEPELLARWYQLGAFGTFFRAHAHLDTKRREPYLLNEPYKSVARDALKLRYSLLPVWYTAFRETTVTGLPILRPQYVMFPQDKAGFTIDDQYYIGSSGLLVKPVTAKGVMETTIYLADDQIYYDYFTFRVFRGSKKVTVPSALNQIPLLVRGGSVMPTRERQRRSSGLMKKDPFTLRVVLGRDGKAQGELYLDDGETYAHERGELVWRVFDVVTEAGPGRRKTVRLSSRDRVAQRGLEGGVVRGVSALPGYHPSSNAFARSIEQVRVERVVVAGLRSRPRSVTVEGETKLEWEYTPGVGYSDGKEGPAGVLTIKDPAVKVVRDWLIVIEL